MIALLVAAFLAVQSPPSAPPQSVQAPAAEVLDLRAAIDGERARQAALPGPISESERLIRMAAVDQVARQAMQARMGTVPAENRRDLRSILWPEVEAVDRRNQTALMDMLPPEGWFTRSRYGAEASAAAFLIVQHAGEAYWDRFLPVLEPLVASGEIQGQEYAMMYDRLQMSREQPQRYGTQITCPRASGKWAVWRLEDPARVDEWRASMGLSTLAEYADPFLANPPPFC